MHSLTLNNPGRRASAEAAFRRRNISRRRHQDSRNGESAPL